MDVATLAEQIFFVTAHISGTDGANTWTGTGFVYAVEAQSAAGQRGSAHFLVTNKHVLANANEVLVQMVRAANDNRPLPGATSCRITDFSADAWAGHPDPEVDVAVMPLSALFNDMDRRGAPPFFRALTPEIALKRAQEKELDALEEVVFIGYPNGLYDTANFTPVARRGTTATPVGLDYRGSPAFLVDASVFPGSSGSPVLILNTGGYAPKTGGLAVGSRAILLGVLAAVHVRQVEGEVKTLPTRLIVQLDDPLNLGIVYKAWTIEACVDELMNRLGMKRLDRIPPSQPDRITDVDQDLDT